jgi:hypothetical protein
VYCVGQVVQTPTVIWNNPVYVFKEHVKDTGNTTNSHEASTKPFGREWEYAETKFRNQG